MKIIPKLVGEIKEYILKEEDELTVGLKTNNPATGENGVVAAVDALKNRVLGNLGNKEKTTLTLANGVDGVDGVDESHLREYKNPNATRYSSWVDVFTKGAQDKAWQNSVYLQKDIFSLAEKVPFTDRDLSVIEQVYEDHDFVTQQAIGGVGVILKNALARRSPLPEEMKVKLKSFDSMLAAAARSKGLTKKKNLERTMDVSLKAHYLKLQGRDSWAEARGNIMGLPENQNVIGILLKKEINKILAGGEPDFGIKRELFNLIGKQSDTKTKIKNRGEESQPKDYIPVNLLILYAVLVKDINLVNTAIEAEGQEIDPLEQNRIKGKFTPKLETILSGLVEPEEMSEIKNILINAHLISKPKKIKPKLENRTMGKTIIISERQAKMLSLLRLENVASDVTKEDGYKTPKDGGYTTQPASGTDYAKKLENQRNRNKDAARKATAKDYKSPKNIKKSLSVNKGQKIDDSEKKLNDYFVKEGIDYYMMTNKNDLLKRFLN